MSFYRWLGIESDSYDNAYFEVYDGSNWVNLFNNGSSTIDESSWTESNYDISAYADENPDFQLRFGIGETDGGWQWCGWNIDDIEIKGYFLGGGDPPDLAYDPSDFADSLAEGETAVHQLTVNNNGIGNLRFRLISDDSWLEFDNTLQNIAPGSFLEYDITINTEGLSSGDYLGALNFTSNDPDTPSGTIPVDLHVYYPDINVTQSSVHEVLEQDQQSVVPLIVENLGAGRMNYTVDFQTFESLASVDLKMQNADKGPMISNSTKEPIGYHPIENSKDKIAEPIYPPMVLGSGGPDAFGYSWIDSDETGGPAYNWIDITSIGTQITGLSDDSNVGPFNIGFDFDFYGISFNSFRFSTNGFISFTSTVSDYSNDPIPTGTNEPHNLIAPFWDDQNFNVGGTAYYYSNNSDSLVISWVDVPHYGSGGPYTYQIIILASGKIMFQYQTMTDPLNSATIGIQNGDGSVGLQVVYNQAYMHNNMAIAITAPAAWLDVTPLSGTVAPFNSCTIDLMFDATDLANGEYTGEVTINSNDPDSPSINIPVTLSVGIDGPMIEVAPLAINDTLVVGNTSDTDLIISNVGTLDLTYSITDDRAWISESVDSGTISPSGSEISVVTLDGSSLPEGSYSGQITVTSNAVNEPTVVIPVSLVIIPPPPEPDMTLNLTEISETVVEDESIVVDLIIGNAGTGDLIFNMTDNATWLTENPTNGSIPESGSDTIDVTLNAAGLSEGTYNATITLTSNDPDQQSVEIQVTLDVITAGPTCEYMPGDLNGDDQVIGGDVTTMVNYFRGISTPADSCWYEVEQVWFYVAGDVNGDCLFIGADVTYLVSYFRGLTGGLDYCPNLPPIEPPVLAVPIESGKENAGEAVVPVIVPDKNKEIPDKE
jgi:archaellum component FlaF (FlaF/FlaG flagellin family)